MMAAGMKIAIVLAVAVFGAVGGYFVLVPPAPPPEFSIDVGEGSFDYEPQGAEAEQPQTVTGPESEDREPRRTEFATPEMTLAEPAESEEPGPVVPIPADNVLTDADFGGKEDVASYGPPVLNRPPVGSVEVPPGSNGIPAQPPLVLNQDLTRATSRRTETAPEVSPLADLVERPSPVPGPEAQKRPDPQGSSHGAAATHVVKAGDTLVAIAREWFGDESKWSLIAEANPGLDTSHMRIGHTLILPTKTASVPDRSSPGQGSYQVRSGDTLSSIAQTFYDDPNAWSRIYTANRTVIGSRPGDIRVGMTLTIPARDS